MTKHMVLAGDEYGLLTVIETGHRIPFGDKGYTYRGVKVRCVCGESRIIKADKLYNGQTTCGVPGNHPGYLGRTYQYSKPIGPPLPPSTGYGQVHKRLRKERGRARIHLCVDCGNPAQQWSYNHQDPNELHEYKATGPQKIMRWVSYSLDLNQYDPMCIRCHQNRDGALGNRAVGHVGAHQNKNK